MASASDIEDVRRNTAEPTEVNYTDEALSDLIDALGVAGASAEIWGEKAASAASLVDVTEAGASHKFSDLHKNALAMQKHWKGLADAEVAPATSGRPKVRVIERQ